MTASQRYLVAARKYRPMQFNELVAQEHVTDTLQNALRLDRLAHAYLFSGPRGVGKTTAARILAKAINCTTPLEEREDGAEPCRTCDSCRSFEEGRSLSIIEMDAASNNKVDDIRELRETTRVPPQGARKKVYIVDEVHMLSTAAFNALLKTLEEPPPYVLFIFATTEPNKVLPTILSRCQRFDFRRIPAPDIVEHLRSICHEERIEADDASLMLLARRGDGALRDALSAFDQAVSLCGTTLRYNELTQALGVVEEDLFFEVTDAVARSSSADTLKLVDRIVRGGYDMTEFAGGLSEHLRNLLVARTLPDADLIEATAEQQRRYAEAAQTFTEPDLLRLLTLCAEAQESLKTATQPRLKLELALLQMAALAHAVDLQTAIGQIDRLEALAREGKLPASLPEATTPQPSTSQPAASARPRPETKPAPTPQPTTRVHEEEQDYASEPPGEVAPPDRAAHAAEERDDEPNETPREPQRDEPAPSSTPQRRDEDEVPSVQPVPRPQRDQPASSKRSILDEEAEAEPEAPKRPSGVPDLFGTPALKKKAALATPAEQPAPSGDGAAGPAAAAPSLGSEIDDLRRHWKRHTEGARAALSIGVAMVLEDAVPHALAGSRLTLAVSDSFQQGQLSAAEQDVLVYLRETTDLPLRQLVVQVDVSSGDGAAGRPKETARRADPYEALRQLREARPVVDALCETFGCEIAPT